MKKILQLIFKSSKTDVLKPGVYSRNVLGRAARLGPAPSYWALIPIKPQELLSSKKQNPFAADE